MPFIFALVRIVRSGSIEYMCEEDLEKKLCRLESCSNRSCGIFCFVCTLVEIKLVLQTSIGCSNSMRYQIAIDSTLDGSKSYPDHFLAKYQASLYRQSSS